MRDRHTPRTDDRRGGGGGGGVSPHRDPGLFPGGLTTSMFIHILICNIGGVFWTPPNSARQNSRPYYFLLLHATVLFHSVAARQVPTEKALFSFLFFFLLLRETTIFLLTRRSVTLPMSARGGTCVIDAPRRCVGSVLHLIFIQK